MNVQDLLATAREGLSVSRVFGQPYEHDGVIVIPAAALRGGVGGGVRRDENGQEGEGGGFGLTGRPVGAYVIKDGTVTWRPAVDVNRVIGLVGAVALAWVFTHGRRRR